MAADDDLIDRTIKFVDNVDPALGENTLKRDRYFVYAQEGFDQFWHEREWPWTQRKTSTTAVLADGTTPTPDDFLEVGRYGSVNDPLGYPFEERPIQELKRLQASDSGAIKSHIYSIGGGLVEDAPVNSIWVPRGWAGSILSVYYKCIPPLIVPSGSSISAIPVTYQYRVMIPYMRYRAFDDKGDPRGVFWFKQFEAGLEQALKTERPGKDTTQYVGGSGLRFMY